MQRELYGAQFRQRRALDKLTVETLSNVVTDVKELSESVKRDLLVAQIAIKYTQSNSVGYAKVLFFAHPPISPTCRTPLFPISHLVFLLLKDGQMVGVGAGQQSRVDCVKLAGRKVETWYLRQHPKVRALPFKEGVKRQDRINARVRYIEGDMAPTELAQWRENFTGEVPPLTLSEKQEFLSTLDGVSLASDAFFPFRDSLDCAAPKGVKYVVAAGGSVGDPEVIKAANEYGMTMAFSGVRLFHH